MVATLSKQTLAIAAELEDLTNFAGRAVAATAARSCSTQSASVACLPVILIVGLFTELVYGRNDVPPLMAAVWGGKDFDHTSVHFNLTFPIHTWLLHFETCLLVQYFNGCGESLLSYRAKSTTVHAGLSLVR